MNIKEVHYSILHPTILQADRHTDGSFSVLVEAESHAPRYAFISAQDYLHAEEVGAIRINFIDWTGSLVKINYSVN